MSTRVVVLGTYDQPCTALFDVDLVRWLAAAGLPPAAVVFKRSSLGSNPSEPDVREPVGDGRLCVHVGDLNASAAVSAVANLQADLLVYAGGRDILREPLLRAARLGCIGGHYGRLPQVRGMATVEWSVVLGLPPTVAIQRISPGIDTGEILMQARVPLVKGDSYASIRDRSYFMTKVMLAVSARRVIADGWRGIGQESSAGRQYYRMHSDLQALAQRLLNRALSATPAKA